MKTPSIFAIALVAAAVLLPFPGTIAEKPEEFPLNVLVEPAKRPAPARVPTSGLRITDNCASESIAFEHSPAKRGYGQG